MTYIKRLLIFFAIALPLVLFAWVACSHEKDTAEPPQEQKTDTTAVLITQIKQCSRLYTTEVNMHKIITRDDHLKVSTTVLSRNINLDIPLSQRKIAIPIDATVKAYIDFSNFSEANIVRDSCGIEVILPDPQLELTQTKVRNSDVRQQVSMFRSDFSDEELTAISAQGRKEIVAAIPQLGVLGMAREGAAKVLLPLLKQMGYAESQVKITFRTDFSPADINRMLTTTTPND